MNNREKRFADFYIETGNAAEAARKAGYAEAGAKQTGFRLLNRTDVKIYVAGRLEQLEAARIATMQEALEFYTSVMRGEVKDQFGLEASLQDRLKAADALMKRFLVADDAHTSTLAKLDAILDEFREAVNNGDA